jgi:hypothetical protein
MQHLVMSPTRSSFSLPLPQENLHADRIFLLLASGVTTHLRTQALLPAAARTLAGTDGGARARAAPADPQGTAAALPRAGRTGSGTRPAAVPAGSRTLLRQTAAGRLATGSPLARRRHRPCPCSACAWARPRRGSLGLRRGWSTTGCRRARSRRRRAGPARSIRRWRASLGVERRTGGLRAASPEAGRTTSGRVGGPWAACTTSRAVRRVGR